MQFLHSFGSVELPRAYLDTNTGQEKKGKGTAAVLKQRGIPSNVNLALEQGQKQVEFYQHHCSTPQRANPCHL